MSNIYIQEPPTSGKVLLETTVGDIDIELWAKETPKACRNFIQLCMEGYYNGTIFHRVIKGFIVQGGDPKGDGTGGESIYGKPFQDELHSRLRFNRRGLIAMCNGGVPHDNGSQFFFTLAACPHLQGKHTIFGKVMGETLFNMLKLEDSLVDHDDKPMYPHKILKAVVLSNPFPDIVPRVLPNSVKSGKDEDEGEIGWKKKDKKSRSGVKDFKLLSFGAEAEEDEEEVAEVNKKFANKGKSTHDLLSDPKLSSEPAVEPKDGEDSDESGSEEDDVESGNEKWANNQQSHSERAERVRNKLREAKKIDAPIIPSGDLEEDEEEEYSLNQDKKRESSKRAEEIREEIRRLKREMKGEKKAREDSVDTKSKTVEKTKEELKEAEKNELLKNYMEEHECFTAKHQKIPPKGSKREAHTMSMLKNFHKRLKMAKEKVLEEGDDADEDLASKDTLDDKEDLDGHASDNWLVHKLQGDEEKPVLARDANKAKGDEWFEIHDPRNPINQRRREASKQAMLSKKASSLAKQAQLR